MQLTAPLIPYKALEYLASNKRHAVLFIACVCGLLFFRANPLLFLADMNYVTPWKYTHYLFSYETEFVKRGLIGDAFRHLADGTSYTAVTTFSYLSLLVLCIALIGFLARPWLMNPGRGTFLLFGVGITSPATIMHYVFDVGRFDIITLLMTLLCMTVIPRLGNPGRAFVVLFLMSIGVLIHEATLVMFVPLLLAWWRYCDSSTGATMAQILTGAGLLSLTYCVATQGIVESSTLEAHYAALTERFGNLVTLKSLQVLHRDGLSENLAYTLQQALTLERILNHLVMAVVLFPLATLLRAILRCFEPRAALLFIACLSPLALYPIGQDHFRWWALALTNIFLALAAVMTLDTRVRQDVAQVCNEKSDLCMRIIAYGMLAGPLAIHHSFDFMHIFSGS